MKQKKHKLLSNLHGKTKKLTCLKEWISRQHKWVLWVIGGLILLSTLIVNLNSISEILSSTFKNSNFFEYPDKFNVLLLPYGASKKCNKENVIIEREVLYRFEDLVVNDSFLRVEVKLKPEIDNEKNAMTYEKAEKLGVDLGADMVIWGDYLSDCESDSTKIRTKFKLINQKMEFLKTKLNQDYKLVNDISVIEKGELTSDIEDLVYLILAFKSNSEKDHKKTIYYLNRIDDSLKEDHYLVYGMLGTSHLVLSKVDSFLIDSNNLFLSKEYFDKSIKLNPKEGGGYFNRAIIFKKLNILDSALSDYSNFIGKYPKESIGYEERSDVYTSMGMYEKALVDIEKAINLDSLSSSAYSSRGRIFLISKMYKKALIDYNKAIELNQNRASYFANRAGLYAMMKNYENAFDDINKAIDLDPENYLLHYNKGNFYYYIDDYDNAIDSYSKSISINPYFFASYQNRAAMYWYKRNGKKYYEDYIKSQELKNSGNGGVGSDYIEISHQ